MPELRALAALSFEAASVAPFQRTMRDWMLFELLKRDGLVDLGDVGRLTAQDLRSLPSIGEQSADEVIELFARIASTRDSPRTPALRPDFAVADIAASSDRNWEMDRGFDEVVRSDSASLTEARDQVAAQILTAMEPGSVGYLFPNLNLIAGLRLSDPALRATGSPGEYLAHGWIARTGVSVIGDLLGFKRQDFLDARGLGPTKVSRIYDYLGRLSSAASSIAAEISEGNDQLVPAFRADSPFGVKSSSPDPRVATVIDWAASVAGAQTWADALALVNASLPDDVARAWLGLLCEPLPLPASGSALTEFLESDPRRARVLLARVASNEPLTLQELAAEFGVTRERTRQIESNALAHMREAFDSAPDWQTVRWAAERIVKQAGTYAPGEALVEALPSWPARERKLVAKLAGYARSDPTLIAEGVLLPRVGDLPLLDGTDFVVDEFQLVEQLQAIGVLPQLVDFALTAIGGVSRVDGQLVRWTGSVADKAVAVLEVRDEPQDVQQLVNAAYGDGSSRSTRNRIFDDPRMMRVTKVKVGLRRWGGAKYSGVAELMLDRLASGPMDLGELAVELAERYEVAPASVRMYAAAPVFKLTGETVALRSARDRFVPRESPWKVRGLYREPATATTVWCVVVDNDMLRGSGRSVPQEIAADLGVAPGERVELQTSTGPIPMAWSETTHSGPQIGSIRQQLRLSGASFADSVVLRFRSADHILEVAKISRIPDLPDAADEIARRTSLSSAFVADPANLAESIGVVLKDLSSSLQARGDTEMAALARRLPQRAGPAVARTPPASRPVQRAKPRTGAAVARHPVVGPDAGTFRVGALAGGFPSPQREDTADSAPVRAKGLDDRGMLLGKYDRAVADALNMMRDAGYNPRAVRRLVAAVGSWKASELLAELTEPSEAFVALYQLGRLDLSIEALMCSAAFRCLFDEAVLRNIVERLAEHGFVVGG